MGTRVLIVDDHAPSRAALRVLLELAGLSVSGEAKDGTEAIAQVEALRPDTVLTDMRMPERDGVSVIQIVKERWPSVRVVAMTMAPALLEVALQAGADAGVLKGCPPSDLLDAVTG